jgi:predicted alpha/beta-fold hydrolase
MIKKYLQQKLSQHQVKIYMSTTPDIRIQTVATQLNFNYNPPWWAQSSWIQFLLLAWKEKLVKNKIHPSKMEYLPVHDGGEIMLAYFTPSTPNINDNKPKHLQPIILYMSGITGTIHESKPLMEKIISRQLTGIAIMRRGHGHNNKPLITPNFNIFGNTQDLMVAIRHIQQQFPSHPLALVGSSAGSAVMVRFLGELGIQNQPGNNTPLPIIAAVGLSPGYNIGELWNRTEGTFLDKYLTKRLKEKFYFPNIDVLHSSGYAPEIIHQLHKAESVREFALAAIPFSGYKTYEEWLEKTCPYRVANQITIPTLCLNARDDPICREEFVVDLGIPLANENPCALIVVTDNGTHCCHVTYNDKTRELDFWGLNLALDFIENICTITT